MQPRGHLHLIPNGQGQLLPLQKGEQSMAVLVCCTYSFSAYVVAILLIHSVNPDEFPIVLQKDPEGEGLVSMSSEVADNDCVVCTQLIHP